MSQMVQAHPWQDTPLGARLAWSPSLQLAVDIILGSAFPMALRWGPDFVLIYNDAYRPILGDKHPWALGLPAREAWAEVWDQIAPLHDAIVTRQSPSIFSDDTLLRIQRRGAQWEDARFTLAYSPVADPTAANGVGGVLVTAVEITERIAAEAALKASEERYGLALTASGAIGTWDWDIVNDRVVADAKFAELYSVEPSAAREGRPIADFVAGIHPDDRDRVNAEISAALAARDDFASEYRLLKKDGAIVWVYARGRGHYDAAGTAIRLPGSAVDITDRKATEEALSDSRGYLGDLLRSSGEAFYAVDRDGATTLCNQTFLRLMGFEREEDAIGRRLHDVIHHSHPDGSHYPKSECPIYQCAANGTPAHIEDELFFRLDGAAIPVEYWVSPVYRDGIHHGAICTFIDVTERRAAQAELARSEAEFRAFSQAMPNHVWASPPDGQLNWFNDRVYEYGGAAPGALDGSGWVEMVHPDDRAEAGERWAQALSSGEVYQVEFRLRRADGVYRWHLARAVPIHGPDGAIQQWIGTNTDIDDQKAAAQALATHNESLEKRVAERTAERDRAWRNSQDLLAVVKLDGTLTAVNAAWTTQLGWRAEALVGRNFADFAHPDDVTATVAAFSGIRQTPLVDPYEYRLRGADGTYQWFGWTAAFEAGLVYANGRNTTTERAQAEALSASQEALRQSQKMDAVGQLTGGIAHDFNNMLAVVVGSLDLLSRRLEAPDARVQRYLDAAADGARRATQLTQRLLAFSRQQPLQPKPIEANRLVAEMSDLLRHAIGADVRLETVLAGGLWRTHADPNQLENIILNLAVNARDAMPDGGRLTIETQNAHLDERYAATHIGLAAGQYVLIAVTDSGSGMPADVIEKAFDPFFTTKPVGKGTGLGLSQVYGFVKQSGGHVKIYSEPDQGTTIKIYLPRLLDVSLIDEAPTQAVEAPHGDDREVILVVEDEPGVRQFTVDALSELGYRVIEADGAAAALRLLDAHPEILLVFTDVVMPDVNGAKLADEVRRRRPGMRILFTTGYTRNAVVHNGVLDAGVEMIGKPFTVDALATKIRAVLERPDV
ncbi:MAG: PAS domain S-box protein [Phenylobacterium sp.]|nr:MAG: PAS domain S-box protein [Phenylobacterium sp.]